MVELFLDSQLKIKFTSGLTLLFKQNICLSTCEKHDLDLEKVKGTESLGLRVPSFELKRDKKNDRSNLMLKITEFTSVASHSS